jgi:hypothetical protein
VRREIQSASAALLTATTGLGPKASSPLRKAEASSSALASSLEPHLGDTGDDGNSSTRRRQALAPLEAFANRESLHALVVHHINKDSAQRASHRVLGTIANRNAPRSMLLFGANPDNDAERILFHDKHNCSPKSPTQLYAIEPTIVYGDDRLAVPTARLVYVRDTEIDPETILGRPSRGDGLQL